MSKRTFRIASTFTAVLFLFLAVVAQATEPVAVTSLQLVDADDKLFTCRPDFVSHGRTTEVWGVLQYGDRLFMPGA